MGSPSAPIAPAAASLPGERMGGVKGKGAVEEEGGTSLNPASTRRCNVRGVRMGGMSEEHGERGMGTVEGCCEGETRNLLLCEKPLRGFFIPPSPFVYPSCLACSTMRFNTSPSVSASPSHASHPCSPKLLVHQFTPMHQRFQRPPIRVLLPSPTRAPLSASPHLTPFVAPGAQSPPFSLSRPSPLLRLSLLPSSTLLRHPLLPLLPSLPTFLPNPNHVRPYPPSPLPSLRLPSPLRLSCPVHTAPRHYCPHLRTLAHWRAPISPVCGLSRRRRKGLAGSSGGGAGAGEEMIQAECNWRGLPLPLRAAATAAGSAFAVRIDVAVSPAAAAGCPAYERCLPHAP
ncbi:unnamed protein product [Closterium sp. Naga37s-1]|nr:unnamed protein product [Closterium sp. Naga37s-1]